MCRLVAEATKNGSAWLRNHPGLPDRSLVFPIDKQVIEDARRIVNEPENSEYLPTDPREFCGRIFHSCYMGTENSSADTRGRAKALSEAIGRYP